MSFWIQLAILLGAILLGARRGGMALGPMGGIGLFIFVFVFGLPPGNPPGTVLGMILAVITALSLLEAAGGLDLVIRFAERILRGNPRWVTVLAPVVTYVLVLASGTQHVIYALLPVIAEVARKAGIRPERPLSISVIATQHGLIASPISAVTVALLAGLAGAAVPLPTIMLITIPATLAMPARRPTSVAGIVIIMMVGNGTAAPARPAKSATVTAEIGDAMSPCWVAMTLIESGRSGRMPAFSATSAMTGKSA